MLHHCTNSSGLPRRWTWDARALDCVPDSLVHQDVADLFRNKRVALVGDSHLRKLYHYLGDYLEDETIRTAPTSDKKEHRDFTRTIQSTGTRIEFYWRAEIRSTTAAINTFLDDGEAPDLLVCDASAHQAKWARDWREFILEIPDLVDAVERYDKKFGKGKPVVWLTSPPFKEVFDPNNEDTQFFYSLKKFNGALQSAKYMFPSGPVIGVDLYRMAEGCIDWCYRDSTHLIPNFNTLIWQILTAVYRKTTEPIN